MGNERAKCSTTVLFVHEESFPSRDRVAVRGMLVVQPQVWLSRKQAGRHAGIPNQRCVQVSYSRHLLANPRQDENTRNMVWPRPDWKALSSRNPQAFWIDLAFAGLRPRL